jgi:hypothetical protein
MINYMDFAKGNTVYYMRLIEPGHGVIESGIVIECFDNPEHYLVSINNGKKIVDFPVRDLFCSKERILEHCQCWPKY